MSTSREAVLEVLSDGKPRASRELVEITGLSAKAIENVLRRLWEEGVVLRTSEAIHQFSRNFKARARNFKLCTLI